VRCELSLNNNISLDLNGVDWIHLAQDSDR
jgi:hypothetical protein